MTHNNRPVHPRSAIGRLPVYRAGKSPAPVDGLTSYKLSSNENPFPPLPVVLEAIQAESAVNRYPDPATTRLRGAIGAALGVDPEDVVTAAGSLGALSQVLAAFAGQEPEGDADEVVFSWRSFEAYPICVTLAGATPVPVANAADGSHDFDALAAAVTPATRVILLCSPNNPTGPAMTHEQVEAFLARVPEDVVVVLDEAYIEFVRLEGAVDGVRLYQEHPNVVVLRTFSKAHGLAGLRVGYSLQGSALRGYVRAAATTFAVTSMAEAAASTSLEHMEDVLARVDELVEERQRVVAGLKELGWVVPETHANFVWLDYSGGEGDAAEFAAAAEARALSVRAFAGEGVRVSIGEAEANTRFLELCAEYPRAPHGSQA
ncbi:histidinol-phosphate transaminase [Falsarthrobacter nasiphocae]|uniref:Histidinol-phosphate aminotransferase n=1 Tax=Falsarthrobacter nasiphocae TaxID=189863 RepID=A0AAE3YG47_9MICC|nr:histidinol-phosphate transaminase [Falsarthrobacter nasiphocae]MDR6892157.1 histidinol-phosphate aminotransferase [Falsarthrobacter nasiphocae]